MAIGVAADCERSAPRAFTGATRVQNREPMPGQRVRNDTDRQHLGGWPEQQQRNVSITEHFGQFGNLLLLLPRFDHLHQRERPWLLGNVLVPPSDDKPAAEQISESVSGWSHEDGRRRMLLVPGMSSHHLGNVHLSHPYRDVHANLV